MSQACDQPTTIKNFIADQDPQINERIRQILRQQRKEANQGRIVQEGQQDCKGNNSKLSLENTSKYTFSQNAEKLNNQKNQKPKKRHRRTKLQMSRGNQDISKQIHNIPSATSPSAYLNDLYVNGCIRRALNSVVLSKANVAQIFAIGLDEVIRIDNAPIAQRSKNKHLPFYQTKRKFIETQPFVRRDYNAQKLLMDKPIIALTPQLKAMIQIVKKNPKIYQKDIVHVLEKQYGMKGVTQTKISRRLKRIREMQTQIACIKKACQNKEIKQFDLKMFN